ncbi:MAG: hypothetical protein HZA54_06435 [Planctomycetes bacterium]|nr:hypothetical protein [Planctomycetota bacterium]
MADRRSTPLPAELADLVERLAGQPHGLGFLHRGYLESVAVTLGVHPFVVDAARDYLETAAGRAELIEAVRHATERRHAGRASAGSSPPPPPPPALAPAAAAALAREAEELIERVRAGAPSPAGATGFARLTEGTLESAARDLRVHPYLILRARGMLRCRDLERQEQSSRK